uniref:Uncharacterized protein n=1 Tax=Romanomermis culicivorax TaxID=13658 RepID=A0A915JQK3_ROMCU
MEIIPVLSRGASRHRVLEWIEQPAPGGELFHNSAELCPERYKNVDQNFTNAAIRMHELQNKKIEFCDVGWKVWIAQV